MCHMELALVIARLAPLVHHVLASCCVCLQGRSVVGNLQIMFWFGFVEDSRSANYYVLDLLVEWVGGRVYCFVVIPEGSLPWRFEFRASVGFFRVTLQFMVAVSNS